MIFHVTNASTLGFASCRLVAHRLEGTVTKNEAEESNTVIEVTGKPHNDQTCAEWVAAAAAPKEETPAADGAAADGKAEADGGAAGDGDAGAGEDGKAAE